MVSAHSFTLFLLAFSWPLGILVSGTLGPGDTAKVVGGDIPQGSANEVLPGSVFDRGLVIQTPKAKDIVREHRNYVVDKRRRFNGTVLAYVTPVG